MIAVQASPLPHQGTSAAAVAAPSAIKNDDLWDSDYLPFPISKRRTPAQQHGAAQQQNGPSARRRPQKTDMDLDVSEGVPLINAWHCWQQWRCAQSCQMLPACIQAMLLLLLCRARECLGLVSSSRAGLAALQCMSYELPLRASTEAGPAAGSSEEDDEDPAQAAAELGQLPRMPDQQGRRQDAPGFDMRRHAEAGGGRQGTPGRGGRGRRGRGGRGDRGARGGGQGREAVRTGYNPYALTDGGIRGASKRKHSYVQSGNRTMTFKSGS